VLCGLGGNDSLQVGAQNYILAGGAAVGSDLLYVERLTGMAGADTLDAREGTGNDKVDGGTGTDTCQKDPGDTAVSCP
jgi:hypothetical protein